MRRVRRRVVSAAGLVTGWTSARAFLSQLSAFVGQHHPVPRPADLSGVEPLRDVALRVPSVTRAGEVGEVRGWYRRPENGVVIVFAHGSPGDRRSLLPEARFLARAGYGFVVFDFPGHGESSGRVHWGAPSRTALHAAVNYALAESDVAAVGLFGFSMGSSLVARVAASEARVGAVVMSGSFTSAREQIRHEPRWRRALTQWPAIGASLRHAPPAELATTSFMSRIAPRPLLLLAGGADVTCPPWMTEQLFAAAGEPKEMLVLEGAGHGRYLRVDADTYLGRIRLFYDAAFAHFVK